MEESDTPRFNDISGATTYQVNEETTITHTPELPKNFPLKSVDNNLKTADKIKVNLSPSSLNTYFQSPLLFYLKYIAKVPDDTEVPKCYGLSGSIVHDCLEHYAQKKIDRDGALMKFLQDWLGQDIEGHPDVKGYPLNKEVYLKALLNGLQIVDDHENHIAEEIISFPLHETETHKIGIKGIVDLQANPKGDDDLLIIDYKTSNSVNTGEEFKRQALFYTMLIHKKKDIIPKKSIFHYLKLDKKKEYEFTIQDIEAFKEELQATAEEIADYGNEIGNFPIGKIDDLFNSKKRACKAEVKRRDKEKNELSGYF
ncbi:MAG: RecB family exonuclease [Patescibacteria group bacterium]|jgi:RecB family exonuclease